MGGYDKGFYGNPDNCRKESSENLNDFTLGEEEKSMNKSGSINQKHNISIESTEKEKSEDSRVLKLSGINGYETPYLGMKVNPSTENLRKLPGWYLSDDDEETYQGKKVIKNKNMMWDIETADFVIDSNVKSRNIFYASKTENEINKKKLNDPPSDESLSDEAYVEDNDWYKSRQSRPSSYYQGIQQFNNRSSNGGSVLRSTNKQVEQKRDRDTFSRLIWGGYHKIEDKNERDSNLGEDNADDEATFINNDPISFLQKGVLKRKKIARLSKSSTKYRPFNSGRIGKS